MDIPIGQLIQTAQAGQAEAADTLFAALYRELHAIAQRELRRNGHDATLGTTSLLHEAYLNVVQREGVGFATRAQFLSYAARAMRGLTIDYVRRRQAKKRGGELYITSSGLEVARDALRRALPPLAYGLGPGHMRTRAAAALLSNLGS